MDNVISLAERRRENLRGAQKFADEFVAWADREGALRNDADALAAEDLARYAYAISRRGRDWLEMVPDDLLASCAPCGHNPEALAYAEQLTLALLRFLVSTQRMRPAEARFLAGWIRSAASLFVHAAQEQVLLSAPTQKTPPPFAPPGEEGSGPGSP